MRIVEQSPDRLVIDIRPVGLMILCLGLFLLFLFLGFGTGQIVSLFTGLTGFPNGSAIPAPSGFGLIGYASVIPLSVAIFALKARRLTFDRMAGTLTIATRGVLGRGETRYPLADFRGASVAQSRSGNNGTTYTAVLHFADQMVKVTPYGTSSSGPSRTATAINAWFGAQGAGPGLTHAGDQAAEIMAALEQAGIKLPR
jgi:hypothetical protein